MEKESQWLVKVILLLFRIGKGIPYSVANKCEFNSFEEELLKERIPIDHKEPSGRPFCSSSSFSPTEM